VSLDGVGNQSLDEPALHRQLKNRHGKGHHHSGEDVLPVLDVFVREEPPKRHEHQVPLDVPIMMNAGMKSFQIHKPQKKWAM
jgi:hypothetical protein